MLLFKKCFLGAWPFSDSIPRTDLTSFQEQRDERAFAPRKPGAIRSGAALCPSP